MKNRIIALVLVVVMSLLALSSCGCYDFAGEDLRAYTEFKYADFKKALEAIEIEDGDFTTDEATRLKITAAKIYSAVVDKIVAATEEDIEGEYKSIAEAYGVDLEQVKASIEADAIAADMKVKKAMDLVKEKAVIKA